VRSVGLLVAGAAIAALGVLPAGAFGGTHVPRGHSVLLRGIRFYPGRLEIEHGETVTWTWNSADSEHNVTFHGLHSKTGSRGSFTVRFPGAGSFSYLCTLHASEGMRGKIIVR
jgi:plastocyanin